MKILTWFKTRIIDHWQSSLTAVLLLVGYLWFIKGRIDFTEFQTYIALVPTVILLLMKNFTSDAPKE